MCLRQSDTVTGQRSLGGCDVARERLEQALTIFEAADADRWAERTRVELGRIGGRRAPASGTLSATERAIASQVAAGRTNREVADALHLSARTVEWNLSKVYRRLGVRSRTELARALAAETDAADTDVAESHTSGTHATETDAASPPGETLELARNGAGKSVGSPG